MSIIMPLKNANSGLANICSFLSNMYLCEPSKDAVGNWKILVSDHGSRYTRELRDALESVNAESEKEIESLISEYTRLFIGPYRLPCPPWESVYTSPKRLLMQEAAVEVRNIYRSAGLEVSSTDIMPDHIGVELNFLSLLVIKMNENPGEKPREKALVDFLDSHLLRWVPQFTADLENATDMLLYKTLARATRNVLDCIADPAVKR